MPHFGRRRRSKQIAGHIGIAEATVRVHLSSRMRKMNTPSRYRNSAKWPIDKLVSAKSQTF
jgi:FixJ family two-component response regulator